MSDQGLRVDIRKTRIGWRHASPNSTQGILFQQEAWPMGIIDFAKLWTELESGARAKTKTPNLHYKYSHEVHMQTGYGYNRRHSMSELSR